MAMRSAVTSTQPGRARRGIRVRGTVQGVGFRPAIYRLASGLSLSGLVRNDADGVWLEIEGPPDLLDAFAARLASAAPALARIDSLETVELPPGADDGFRVDASA